MQNKNVALGLALAGAFILGATVIGFSSARSDNQSSQPPAKRVTTSFSDLQEDEIGALVHAYLMDNPEVVIETVNRYYMEQRLAEEDGTKNAAKENIAYLLDEKTSYVTGKNPDKAKIAIVEMYDYHCGYCKKAAGMVKSLVKADADVKIVFRELPIFSAESEYAAEMSLAARDQGKFLDLHFALLNASGPLTKDRVDGFARKQGLDVDKMHAAIKGSTIPAIIESNHQLAAGIGVSGTPIFIIVSVDGSYVDVVQGFNEELIKDKLKQAKKAIG